MVCPRCNAEIDASDKFCRQCGSPLDPQLNPLIAQLRSTVRDEVETALAARLKDQKVVEIETTEKIVERLTWLGKLIGIPLGLLAVLLSAWGINSLLDVHNKIKDASDKAVAGIGKKAEDASKELSDKVSKETDDLVKRAGASAKETVDAVTQTTTRDLARQAKDAQQQFDRLRNQEESIRADATALEKDITRIKPQIASFNQRLGNVEGAVSGLLKAAKCETDENKPVSTALECHANYPNGCSVGGAFDAYLNSLKNVSPPVDSRPIGIWSVEDFVTLDGKSPKALTRLNHEEYKNDLTQLGEGRIVGVIGYLYRARLAGAESANCQLLGPENVDFSLSVGPEKVSVDQAASQDKSSIVVEVTPHYRANLHPDWRIEKLSGLVGRQVKVTGQLLMDTDHYTRTDDCSFSGASKTCWRASAWEIHPITEIYVCVSDRPCTPEDPQWKVLKAVASP